MKKQSEATPVKSLRDAYKVRGFRVLATLDSYDIEPPALALTLSRRAKKQKNHVRRLRENLPQRLRQPLAARTRSQVRGSRSLCRL
jgi:hypothetical protein